MLSSYSSQSLETLLRLLPDLTNSVQERADTFVIELVTPSGWDFWISSAEQELSVGFAEYHCHFGWHEGTDPQQDATRAAAFIHALRTGELVLAAWYQEGQYRGARPLKATEDPRPQTCFQRWWRRKQTLQLKKWAK